MNVLIAHQSTIPHYRIPFFNALEELRPNSWIFKVAFDPSEFDNPSFFEEKIEIKEIKFPIHPVNTIRLPILNESAVYQTFLRAASNYDLIVVENAIYNLTYPLCHLHRFLGKKVAYWGHGKDRKIEKPEYSKYILEKIKIILSKNSDGFFAYTQGVADYLISEGIDSKKIYVLNNTIDIDVQRAAYNSFIGKREVLKHEFGIENKKVLLFVGRLTERKRFDFLLDSFEKVNKSDERFHLIVVGSDEDKYREQMVRMSNITFLGPIASVEELAPIYTVSDIYVFPGSVGLGPLQALCYDLPVITIASAVHGPEIEYLSPANSIILPELTTPDQFSQAIIALFSNNRKFDELKSNAWPSIQHLTIENMAKNFITGVNRILSN